MLVAMLAWMFTIASAQQRNIISIPDATVQIGQVSLPVVIENTDEIVAAQFDVTLPTAVTAQSTATLSERGNGHNIIIRNMGATRYRVMLYSDGNLPLRGQAGTAFNLLINVPQDFTEGSEHPLSISNATLTLASGENVLTEATAGKLIVAKLPDITVTDITADRTALTPGEKVIVSWNVKNVGGVATTGGWSEQISLVNRRGTVRKLIATTYADEILGAGDIAVRQAEIVLPKLIGIEGEARLQVRLVADSDAGESSSAGGNNTLVADEILTLSKALFVECTPSRILENAGGRIAVKVSRSGDWSGEQTFTLSATEDSRITLPASVTIAAGQSGAAAYLTVADNTILDTDSVVTITAKGGNYDDASIDFIIEDNEYPDLKLTASKAEVAEGETFQLTVTTSRLSAQPITVTLTSETANRFSFPQTLTIASGETSATVDVEAIDDELPSLVTSNAFTVSAPKHNKAEAVVILQDNDLPVLELTLTPNKVQENAGVVAVAGVLRRTTNTNSKITVRLTDDSNGGLYYGNTQLVLEKGVDEVHFNFGPVDNAIVDGDRSYTVTAAVWLSSCSCSAAGESAGAGSATSA